MNGDSLGAGDTRQELRAQRAGARGSCSARVLAAGCSLVAAARALRRVGSGAGHAEQWPLVQSCRPGSTVGSAGLRAAGVCRGATERNPPGDGATCVPVSCL